MNDDFLHRIRKPPSPEFLAELKARLDRQPAPPPLRRRFSFVRGLVIGALLGGVGFALGAATLNGVPHSWRALVRAPAELLARLMPGGQDSGARNKVDRQGAAPFGAGWLPDRFHSRSEAEEEPAPDTGEARAGDPAKAAAPVGSAAGPNAQPAPAGAMGAIGATAAGAGGLYAGNDGLLTIVASPAAFPIARAVADHISTSGTQANSVPGAQVNSAPGAKVNSAQGAQANSVPGAQVTSTPGAQVKAELDAGGMRYDWCLADDHGPLQVLATDRRITPEEFRACMRNGSTGIIELKIGYQAVVLARAKSDGPLNLSARDLFRALAWHIPVPDDPALVMDNPNFVWSQVNPALPNDRIQVFGESPTSTAGRLALDLLLEPGCNTYPGLAALRASDWPHYNEICKGARQDGVYATSAVAGMWMYLNELVRNPTVIGIYSFDQFEGLEQVGGIKDKLVLVSINGVEPTAATIANGTYPASHALYLYANKRRIAGSRVFGTVVHLAMGAKTLYGNDYPGWGFIKLDKAESAATLAALDTLKELQY
jgi:phosphate transport system substrate-binding protein